MTGPFFDQEGEYDNLIRAAAIETLHQIDPYTAGIALAQGNYAAKEKGLSWIVDALDRAEAEDRMPRHRRMYGLSNIIPRAKLSLANVLLSLKHFGEAIHVFQEANKAYMDRNPSREQWALAYDGIATAYLLISEDAWNAYKTTKYLGESERNAYLMDLKTSQTYVDYAINLVPSYDSAFYHRAQIHDAEARHWFEQDSHADDNQSNISNCDGTIEFNRAVGYYNDLTAAHPSFAVAYSNKAVLIMQKLLWVRSNKDHLRCVSEQDTASSLELTLFEEARSSFVSALARDDQLPSAWLQSGILYLEQQDPAFPINKLKMENRLLFLKMAISKFEQASVLTPWDAYVWERLANARRQLANLGGADSQLSRMADEALQISADKHDEARFSEGALPPEAFDKTGHNEQSTSQGRK